MDIWQEVREKLAIDYKNPGVMPEQTHNPLAVGADPRAAQTMSGDNADKIREMLAKKYRNKRERKNLL